jgi:hypothetical protein
MILNTSQIMKEDHLAIVKDYRFATKPNEETTTLGKRKNGQTTDEALKAVAMATLEEVFQDWPKIADDGQAKVEEYNFNNGYYSNYYQANQ